MKAQQKISLGSVLATLAGAGTALSIIFEWTLLGRPWGFLLGFITGVAAGTGMVLVIAGLLAQRRTR